MTESDPAIKKTEGMRNVLAFLLVGAFIAMLPALFMWAIPANNKDIVTYMVGQLSGMALTVLGFFFVNKVGQDAVDAKRADNTHAAFEAIKAATTSWPSEAVVSPGSSEASQAADDVADAAVDKADQIRAGKDA